MDTTWTEQFYTPSQESSLGIEQLVVFKVGNIVRRKDEHINRSSNFPALYGAEMVVKDVHVHNGEQKLIFNDGFVHGWQAHAYELVAEQLTEEMVKEKTVEEWLDYYTNSKGNIVAAELLEDILDNPEKIANMLLRYAEQMEK